MDTRPEPPMVFRGRLADEDVYDIQDTIDLLSIGRPSRRMVGLTITLVAGLGIWLALAWESILATAVLVVVWFYLVVAYFPLRRWRAVRRSRSNANAGDECTATITATELAIEYVDWRHYQS